MNNKGQSLVAFVLLLPVFLLFVIALIDLGNIQITKYKYQNEVKDTVRYGINHFEDENLEAKLTKLLDENLDGEKSILIGEDNIKINVKKEIKTTIKNKTYDINITYIGNKQTQEITKE